MKRIISGEKKTKDKIGNRRKEQDKRKNGFGRKRIVKGNWKQLKGKLFLQTNEARPKAE